MTEASVHFYEKFDSFRIMAIKEPFKLDLMDCKIFLKNCKDYFHSKDQNPADNNSITAEGKNGFSKKLYFLLKSIRESYTFSFSIKSKTSLWNYIGKITTVIFIIN